MDFIRFTKPDYRTGWFNSYLAEVLELFLAESMAKHSPRLIIEAPPRHGKTEETSIRFPAWSLGRFPDMTFIATSHTGDLAQFINREIQRVIDDDGSYAEVFAGTQLWGKNIRTVADGTYLRNSDIFEIVNHRGIYKCAGIGGPITGKGGHVLLCDDPIKDAQEAASQVVRDSQWEWWKSTFYSRQEPGAGIILIMTRWHEDDIAGRLLARAKLGGEHWDEVKFPAVAEHDECHPITGALFRKEGEALHPERYSLKLLDAIKLGTEDAPGCGSKVWASLYQQRPAAAEGNIFKREKWQWLRPIKQVSMMTSEELKLYLRELGVRTIIQSWDTALGQKKQNDLTACATLAIAKNRYYLLDVWQGQIEFPDVMRQVQVQYDTWRPNKVFVEGGGALSGKAVIQTMKRGTKVPLFESVRSTDKVLRADTISPHQESGLVTLFEGERWQSSFIDHCANFPNIAHDDDVDAFIGAMEEATAGHGPMTISNDFIARLTGLSMAGGIQ